MTEHDAQRAWVFKQLKQSLQALAAAGSDQPALFPDYRASADELAFGYDHWRQVVRSTYDADLSEPQTNALDAIDRKLATMSRDAEFDVDLWTEAALSTSEHWSDLRRLAAYALDALGWSDGSSPEDSVDETAFSDAELPGDVE